MHRITPYYINEVCYPRKTAQSSEIEQYMKSENVDLMHHKAMASKSSSDAIRDNAIAILTFNELLSVKDKAKFLQMNPATRIKYDNIIKDYHNAIDNKLDFESDELKNITKLYEEKPAEDSLPAQMKIYEYKDNLIIKENIISKDNNQTVNIIERVDNGSIEYLFVRGKLSEYKVTSFNNRKKTINEIFNFDIQSGTLKKYYKNIAVNNKGDFVAEKLYQFDENGKLIDYQTNTKYTE